MPSIAFGRGSYKREGLPEFISVNMYSEAAPSTEKGVALLDRSPLALHSTVGAGPVRGVYSQPGTFDGDIFTVSGGNLYRDTTLLLAINGSGPVSFAASGTEILVTAGNSLYSYNGTDTVAVALPDGFSARAVTFISGHFVVARDGSQKYYWSAQLDGRSFDALDFASAESEPDSLVDAVTMRGNLYLLGQETIEPWFYTGDLNLPFSLAQQRLFPKGAYATGCAIELDNALLFVGSDGIVYRTADVPERLSNHSIEQRIAASTTASAFGYIFEGHTFFCVRLDAETVAIDLSTGQWNELQSYGRANFAGRSATMQGQMTLFGDDATGKLWSFVETFDEEPTLIREFTAAFPIKGGTVTVDNLLVEASAGHTDTLVGQGSDAKIEVASSRDAGVTFGAFRTAPLGKQGEYRKRARLTRLGMFDGPGAMFKVRLSDPVKLRVTDVLVNEPGGGRGR